MVTGKVVWHFTMSLDGFIAGPGHDMDWLEDVSFAPGVVDETAASTGAILAGRRWYDEFAGRPEAAPYGGRWNGPIFVLTHRPEDEVKDPSIRLIESRIADAVNTALAAADGKDLVLFGAEIGRQCLDRGLIDELRLHVAPVMLGDGVRAFDRPGGQRVHWAHADSEDPTRTVDLRLRPARLRSSGRGIRSGR